MSDRSGILKGQERPQIDAMISSIPGGRTLSPEPIGSPPAASWALPNQQHDLGPQDQLKSPLRSLALRFLGVAVCGVLMQPVSFLKRFVSLNQVSPKYWVDRSNVPEGSQSCAGISAFSGRHLRISSKTYFFQKSAISLTTRHGSDSGSPKWGRSWVTGSTG